MFLEHQISISTFEWLKDHVTLKTWVMMQKNQIIKYIWEYIQIENGYITL